MNLRIMAAYWVLLVFMAAPIRAADDAELQFTAEKIDFFEQEVRPLLKQHCYKCHGGDKARGGLRLTSRQAILEGGDSGPAVELDHADESLLLGAVNYDLFEMPPSGKLAQEKIDVLSRWIELGLPWTPGEHEIAHGVEEAAGEPEVNDETRSFWSFVSVQRPAPPSVENETWVSNPIDAFILAKLEEAGLTPVQPASKQQLLRRAYYDLTGLPPTPKEVREFLADDDPLAFERVVDRLLESPQYGVRWGRHWLDLVRYAETNSYERDGPKPFAWRYRDYVIDSFNDDKPYDQFIIEQLAGDEVENPTPESIVATGYYRLGIWDDEPADPKQALYDDLDDIVGTTGQVFLGMTVNCARCHDHKLDPFPQQDYYRLLSFFNGVTRFGVRSAKTIAKNSLRPIGTPEELKRNRREVEAHQAELRSVAKRIEEIEGVVKPDFEPVEEEEFKHEQARLAIVKKRVPRLLSEERFGEYARLFERRKELSSNKPAALAQALCVTEIGREPRETHVLIRGNPHSPGDLVEPGFPSVLGAVAPEISPPAADAQSCGRRLALARWIASEDCPLTARVMANRVWQYHFGRGIVRSPNNFGLQGRAPTHPKLLDWLASQLVSQGWRLKPLHRLIMLSSAYRMSSQATPEALEEDPQNNFFWRFDMRRLSAEEIRDSILAANGSLNPELGGPSIYTLIPQEVLAGQSRPGDGWGKSPLAERSRRSAFIHVKRSLVTPILATFDMADTDATCPVRFATVQPTQALSMLNSDFLKRQAEVFGDAARSHAPSSQTEQVRFVLWRVMQRPPTEMEIDRGGELILSLTKQGMEESDAFAQFCLLALNLNEFLFLD